MKPNEIAQIFLFWFIWCGIGTVIALAWIVDTLNAAAKLKP